ncbi:MAG: 4Fe-4S dicluster domain-containing protein [Campylobacterales bacterium]|nr:4Fe-4S dicluster domain-containing protein [Campylobacterales bacterium]
MKLLISRFIDGISRVDEFEVELENKTFLEIFSYIKANIDSSFTFNIGCKSGVCGCCAVRVNNKEVLACEYKPSDNDFVEPLKNLEVIKDLVCETKFDVLKCNSYLIEYNHTKPNESDEQKYDIQSDCILCFSCYSSCPVFELNSFFLGPFALSRVYRYTIDSREKDEKEHIDKIQQNGIWDCTLCGNCTMVCPQGLDPKSDINMLRTIGYKYNYFDTKFSSFNSLSFDFGFNY